VSNDAKRRQKKLERRAAIRNKKKHALRKGRTTAIWEQLIAASKYPVLHCRITDGMESSGLGSVLLGREFPDGRIAAAVFLVDVFCRGVKDVVVHLSERIGFEDQFLRKLFTPSQSHAIEPADARKLIEESVAYAKKIGIGPHPDYSKALLLFGSDDASQSTATFEFGKGGKPFFVAGPNDTIGQCKQIMAILERTCGPDGFHFAMPIPNPEELEVVSVTAEKQTSLPPG